MKKEYQAIQYREYRKRMIILVLLVWIIPLVYLLTKDEDEVFRLGYVIFAFVFSVITPVVMIVLRKIFLGILIASELDLRTVYELEKRKHNELYNLRMLMNVYLFEGEFENVVACSDKVLQMSSKTGDIFIARHQKILALFLSERKEEIPILIEQQRQLAMTDSKRMSDLNLYYVFIEKYFSAQYEEALQVIGKRLEAKNIEVQNQTKVFIYYLMRLCYLKMGKSDEVQDCTNKILSADKNRRTFCSR